MKNIKSVLLLVLSIIILSFILDKIAYYLINNIEEQVFTGQNVGKFNQFLHRKDSLDLLIIGNSRANRHYNSEILSKNSFNIGLDGKGLAYFWTIVSLLPENKQQTIILNLDPNNVFEESYKGEDIVALNYKYAKNKKIRKELNRNSSVNPLIDFYWCIGYNSKIIGIFKNYYWPKYDYKTYNGFDGIRVTAAQKIMREKRHKKQLEKECDSQTKPNSANSLSLEYLQLIKDYCIENNKDLYVITSPLRVDKCKSDNVELNNLMKTQSIKYWDFSDFFENENDPDLWKDNSHLSLEGANKFTAAIVENVLKN